MWEPLSRNGDAVDARVIKTVKTGKAIYVKDAPEFVLLM